MISKHALVRMLLVVPVLAAGVALKAPPPAAAALVCNDPSQQFDRTYKGNVIVPADGECDLFDAVIRGSVTAEPGAIVYFQGTEVRGPIIATNPATFTLIDVVVRGSVTTTGSAGSAGLKNTEVRGDVVLTGNVGDSAAISDTVVRGSATVSGNNLASGLVEISFSTIEGNLVCENNTPSAVGGFNTVGGVKTGECEFV